MALDKCTQNSMTHFRLPCGAAFFVALKEVERVLCQEGYPCVYLRMVLTSKGMCTLATCPMIRVNDKVHDRLSGEITSWNGSGVKREDKPPSRSLTQKIT